MPTDLFTTTYLGSYAGLVAATYLLVQFFKDPIRQHLSDWWVRILAVAIALVIQLFVLYVASNFTVEAIGLAVMNSFLIAITAAGAHDISKPISRSTVTAPVPALDPQVQSVITPQLISENATTVVSNAGVTPESVAPEPLAVQVNQ